MVWHALVSAPAIQSALLILMAAVVQMLAITALTGRALLFQAAGLALQMNMHASHQAMWVLPIPLAMWW